MKSSSLLVRLTSLRKSLLSGRSIVNVSKFRVLTMRSFAVKLPVMLVQMTLVLLIFTADRPVM